nr:MULTISPECIES: SDR family oxidoreductase [Alphaproteobacteria]
MLIHPLDVTNEDEVTTAVKAATNTFGRLDVLVNNLAMAPSTLSRKRHPRISAGWSRPAFSVW